MPDGEVAAQLHRSRMAVWERRKELGIPAYLGQTIAEMAFGVRVEKKPPQGWTAQLRRKLKMRQRTPPHRWTPAEDRMLGTKPDKELARKMGISAHAVAYRRQQLGIKQCPPAYKFWTVAELRMLGTVPDRDLAKRLGRPLSSIQCQRCILGIKRYRPHVS